MCSRKPAQSKRNDNGQNSSSLLPNNASEGLVFVRTHFRKCNAEQSNVTKANQCSEESLEAPESWRNCSQQLEKIMESVITGVPLK